MKNPNPPLSLVPPDTNDIDEIWEQVHRFEDMYGLWDAYGRLAGLAELSQRITEQSVAVGEWTGTVREFMGCLLMENRRYHHYGYDPSGEDLAEIINLYQTIRQRWGELE